MQRREVIITSLVLVALVAAGFAVFTSLHNKPKNDQATAQTQNDQGQVFDPLTKALQEPGNQVASQTGTNQPLVKVDYKNLVRYFTLPGTGGRSSGDFTNLQLMAYYNDQSEQLVIANMKDAMPEIFGDFPQGVPFIRAFNTSYDKKEVSLLPYIGQTQREAKVLYIYNTETGAVRKSKISTKLFENYDLVGDSDAAAPDNTDLAMFVPNTLGSNGLEQTLYGVNVFNETMRVLIVLDGTETFNGGSVAHPLFDILPYGDHTIRVAIYDQNLKNPNYDPLTDHGQSVLKTYRDYGISPQ